MNVKSLLSLFNGGSKEQAGTPFGSALTVHEVDHMIARGMGRHLIVGAESTGLVGGGAGTVPDNDQPELAIGVPEGYAIKVIRIGAQIEAGLAAADNDENEVYFGVDTRGTLQGPLSAETCVIENPTNMRTDLGYGSACQCASAFSADMQIKPKYAAAADPVLDIELCRAVERVDITTAAGMFLQRLDLVYEPRHSLLLVGPCTLLGYWGGTVATVGGFAQVSWVEGRVEEFFHR